MTKMPVIGIRQDDHPTLPWIVTRDGRDLSGRYSERRWAEVGQRLAREDERRKRLNRRPKPKPAPRPWITGDTVLEMARQAWDAR